MMEAGASFFMAETGDFGRGHAVGHAERTRSWRREDTQKWGKRGCLLA